MRLGIDLGGTKIEGIALDGSREVARMRVRTPRDDYGATLAAIVRLVTDLEQTAGKADSIGFGIPGTLSPSTGLVKNANSVWLIGRALQDDLQGRSGAMSGLRMTRIVSRCLKPLTALALAAVSSLA
jgi:fructokinase